jgi:ABC-type multidrug transport system fused ATPase/permease subunit
VTAPRSTPESPADPPSKKPVPGTVLGNVAATWWLLSTSERRAWARMVPVGVLAAVVEVVCAGAIFAVARVATDREPFVVAGVRLSLASAALVAVVAFAVKNLVGFAQAYAQHTAVESGQASATVRVFHALIHSPWQAHVERGLVEARNEIFWRASDVFVLVVGPAANVLVNLLVGVALLVPMISVAPLLTLATIAALACWVLGLQAATRTWSGRLADEVDVRRRRSLQIVEQGLSTLREIAALGRSDAFVARLATEQHAIASLRQRQLSIEALPRAWIESFFVLLMLVALAALHPADGAAGGEGFGVLGLAAYTAMRVLPLANGTTWLLWRIRAATPMLVTILADQVDLWRQPAMSKAVVPVRPGGARVRFEGVSFAFAGCDAVLRNVDLDVEAGSSVAIVGPTGAGKSTLLGLCAGGLTVDVGHIGIEGRSPRDVDVRVGFVPQEVTLVDGTVADNVCLGVPLAERDHALLEASLHVAALDDPLALPRGKDTIVGSAGMRLSGGQRQRVALARAMYHQPALLLLDEATSALDPATEAVVVDRVLTAARGKTTVVLVTHRPHVAARCARTLRLDGGRLGADGGVLP